MSALTQRGCRLLSQAGCVRNSSVPLTSLSSTSVQGRPTIDDIPGPRGVYDLPFLGTALHLYPFTNIKVDRLNELFLDLHRRYGKIVRFRTGLHPGVFLFDPDYIQTAIRNEGQHPERISPPLMEVYKKRVPEKLCSVIQETDWRSTRSAAQKHLKMSTIVNYLHGHENCAKDLVERMRRRGQSPFNPEDDLRRYFSDANAEITFNRRLGLLSENIDRENEHFLLCVADVFKLVAKSFYTFPAFKYIRTPMYNRFESARTFVLEFCEQKVQEFKRDLRRHSSIPEDNLLKKMIADDNIPPDDVIRMSWAFILGGTEPSTNILLWNLWLLGMNPREQEILHEEIMQKVGRSSPLTAENLSHMPYLKACVKESFRCVFPSVNGSMRVLPNECEIGGYVLPKGTHVYFGHNALCRSEEYFENPDLFMPERWLPGANDADKQRRMSLCSLPFGLGKRNCLGRRLAEQQINAAVIQIIRSFKIVVPDKSRDIQPIYTTFAFPNKPLELTFIPR